MGFCCKIKTENKKRDVKFENLYGCKVIQVFFNDNFTTAFDKSVTF